MRKRAFATLIVLVIAVAGLTACGTTNQSKSDEGVIAAPIGQTDSNLSNNEGNGNADAGNTSTDSESTPDSAGSGVDNSGVVDNNNGTVTENSAGQADLINKGSNGAKTPSEQVVANASSADVLVNKTYRLPQGYVPPDLVYPNIPFTFTEKIDKRKLRKEAAAALEKLVAGANKDKVALAGVSGYRSESRQRTLFDNYVKKDGLEAASRYSAKPGYSEHQTGLAIDLSGTNGKCAAEDCFAGTKEANWIAKHSYEYGFIVRYLDGKEKITGYKYEPWHIRYVGKQVAKEIYDKGITLEEYYGGSVPVMGRN